MRTFLIAALAWMFSVSAHAQDVAIKSLEEEIKKLTEVVIPNTASTVGSTAATNALVKALDETSTGGWLANLKKELLEINRVQSEYLAAAMREQTSRAIASSVAETSRIIASAAAEGSRTIAANSAETSRLISSSQAETSRLIDQVKQSSDRIAQAIADQTAKLVSSQEAQATRVINSLRFGDKLTITEGQILAFLHPKKTYLCGVPADLWGKDIPMYRYCMEKFSELVCKPSYFGQPYQVVSAVGRFGERNHTMRQVDVTIDSLSCVRN